MAEKIAKTSDINLKIKVDENEVPVEIEWNATDGGN